MDKSESIMKLTEALIKAQSEMASIKKDKYNDYFKSHYADLNSYIETSREPLAKNGLVIIQTVGEHEQGALIETLLAHVSGEWIKGSALIPMTKRDPQALGSAVTYGRRYSLGAILNLTAEDDDGEKAMDRGGNTAPAKNNNNDIATLAKHVAAVKDASSATAVGRMIAKVTDQELKQRAWGSLIAKATSLNIVFDKEAQSFALVKPNMGTGQA